MSSQQSATEGSLGLKKPRNSWWHDDEYIATARWNILAVIEVFLATSLYYFCASVSPWPFLSLITLLAAPLLLLRSERSIERGVELLTRALEQREPTRLTTWLVGVFLTLLFLALGYWTIAINGGFLATTLSKWTFTTKTESLLAIVEVSVLSIAIFGWVTGLLGIELAVMIATIGIISGFAAGASIFFAPVLWAVDLIGYSVSSFVSQGRYLVILAIVVLSFSAAGGIIAGRISGAGVVLASLLAIVVGLLSVIPAISITLSAFGGVVVAVWLGVIGSSIGLCLGSLWIRTRATLPLSHLKAGIAAFSRNWFETVLVSNLRHSPALIPRAGRLSPIFNIAMFFSAKGTTFRVFGFILAFPLALVTIVYRWNIKASALVWGPIALGLSPTTWQNYTQMREQTSLNTDKWIFVTSVAFLVGLCTVLLTPYLPNDIVTELPRWVSSETVRRLRPEAGTIRHATLFVFSVTFGLQLLLALTMRTQHDKPLSSAADFQPYLVDEKLKIDLASFEKKANLLRRALKVNTMIAIVTVWVFGLKYAVNSWPVESQKVLWDWLVPVL
jgi:hypothetical protein